MKGLRVNIKMNNTVTEMLEGIASEFCDKYCKYSDAPIPEGKTEDWLYLDEDSPCNNCPINRM